MTTHEIFTAVEAGDVERVRAIAGADPGAVRARDASGVSPVVQAVYRGQDSVVDALLETRPELDVFEAAAVGDVDRVRELVDTDPSLVSQLSPDGFTPLHLASFFGRHDVADLLLERGAPLEVFAESAFAPVTPLQSAAAASQTEIARRLLDAGADVHARGRGEGFTALHSAAQNGNVELVRLLLDRGADPSATTDDGRTPRDLATSDEVRALL